MPLNPIPNDMTMMNAQVVQYKVNFPTSVLYQPFAELDKRLGIHRFGVDHKPDFALIRDRGDQIDPFTFRIKMDRWGFSFRRIASTMLTIIAQARFHLPSEYLPLPSLP